MSESIKALLVVLGEDTHGLLAHRTLIRISGRLVVVREGDRARQTSENHAGVNLRVGIGVGIGTRLLDEFHEVHGNHGLLRLTSIQILNQVVAGGRLPAQDILPHLTGMNAINELLS